jgi:predicted Zn-dependent peptidase
MASRAWLAAVPFLVFGLLAPAAVSAQQLRVNVQERTLANGVKVLVWERPSAGRIGARMFYRVDVAAERPGTVGLTHMLEHYMFMGSRHVGTSDWEAERPWAEAVERISRDLTDEQNRERDCFRQRDVFAEVEADCRTPRVDSLQAALDAAFARQQQYARGTDFDWIYQPAGGTGLTASTGRDWMKFDIDLPANRLELFMWAERSRLEHPVFRFFEPEREVVVDQIRRADNRPDGPFDRVLRSMTYDAHPYGWAHWFSDLTRATREDHWEIFYKNFIPQNTIIVIVGEVRAEEVFRLAERYFGSWQMGRPAPRLRTVEPPPVGHKRLVVETAAGPSFVLNVQMPAIGHRDTHVFEVLAEVLGGDQGILARRLVEGSRNATRTTASAAVAKYTSHFSVRVDARGNGDLDAVEAGVDAVLSDVGAGSVTPSELDAAASRLVQSLARSFEQIGSSAVQIGAMEAIHRWQHLNALPDLWAAVTPADLARVVNTYFLPHMRTTGVLRRAAPGTADSGDAAAPGHDVALSAPAASDTRVYGDAIEPWPLRGEGGPRVMGLESIRTAAEARAAASAARGRRISAAGAAGDVAADPSAADPSTADPSTADPSTADPVAAVARTAPTEPLAIAEQPWYAPPWMAERRPAGFTTPAPVDHWRDLRVEPQPFVVPQPARYLREIGGGLRAIIVRDTLLPIVQVTALIDARPLDEPAGREGLAMLTAELLRAGAAGLDRAAIDAELRRLGATLSVSTDANRTRLHMLVPALAGTDAARLLARIVGQPTLAPTAFDAERERQALRAERAMDDAASRLRSLFHSTLYGDVHPLGRSATPHSVRAATLDEVRTFHAIRYAPERVIFAVSGAVDSGAVERALRDGFGTRTTAAQPAPRHIPATASPDGIRVVTAEFDSRQAHVMFGHLGLQGIPEDHAALEVMHHILTGGAFVSRMMEQLRTRTGITAAQYGAAEPGRGVRNPYVWRFSGNPETLARGIRLALEEIRQVRDEGITQEEFEAARTSYIDGLIPASYDTPHRTAERLAEKEIFGVYLYRSAGYLNYYAGDAAQIDALRRLTLADVNAAARKYLDPDNVVVAVVGPLAAIRAGAAPEEAALVR